MGRSLERRALEDPFPQCHLKNRPKVPYCLNLDAEQSGNKAAESSRQQKTAKRNGTPEYEPSGETWRMFDPAYCACGPQISLGTRGRNLAGEDLSRLTKEKV